MIKTRQRTEHYVVIDREGVEVELPVSFEPADGHDPLVEKLPAGGYVVGYLSRDWDPPNPFEDDGMGKIYSCHRQSSREQHAGFREALGLNDNWERDPDLKINPLAVRLDCYQHGGEVWAVSGSARSRGFPDQQWDVGHGAGVWVPDDSCLENIWYHVAQQLVQQPGDQLGWQPYREGKKTKVYLKRAGGRKRVYDSFENLVNSQDYLKLGAIADAVSEQCVKQAESAVESYNEYLAGDCYGVCVDVLDADLDLVDDDACWGYWGSDYAQEELKSEVQSRVQAATAQGSAAGAAVPGIL